jgi:hypothetical protein
MLTSSRGAAKRREWADVAGSRWTAVAGIVLILGAALGFFTVADDLRHKGELAGVGGVLLAGCVLLVAGMNPPATRGLALHWVAVGIGIGIGAGAAFDHVLAGVGGGAALGAIKMAISRPPH